MVTVVSCRALGKGSYRVRFDDGRSCRLYRSELRRFGIMEGSSLDEETYATLIGEVLTGRAKKRALHLLEKSDRTEYQLRQRLSQADYPAECVDAAVEYVRSFRYLDDARYAENFVRCAQERQSAGQIRRRLAERGVGRDEIEQALTGYETDETGLIRSLLDKRQYRRGEADAGEFRRNYQYLRRRGFAHEKILSVMGELTT